MEANLNNCAIASESTERALDMAIRHEEKGDTEKANILLNKAINFEEGARERGAQPISGIPIRIM